MQLKNAFIKPLKYKSPFRKTLSVSWSTLEGALNSKVKEQQLAMLNGRCASHGRLNIEATTSNVMRLRNTRNENPISKIGLREKRDFVNLEKRFKNEHSIKPLPLVSKQNVQKQIVELVNAGIGHFQAHRLREAEQHWRKALELDKNCKEARNNLAVLQIVLQMKIKSKKSIH